MEKINVENQKNIAKIKAASAKDKEKIAEQRWQLAYLKQYKLDIGQKIPSKPKRTRDDYDLSKTIRQESLFIPKEIMSRRRNSLTHQTQSL